MTVHLIDAALDAELQYLKDNVTERYICAGSPTTRAAAITAALCTLTGLTSGSFTGQLMVTTTAVRSQRMPSLAMVLMLMVQPIPFAIVAQQPCSGG